MRTIRHSVNIVLLTALFLFGTSCANTNHSLVKNDDTARGIRYFRSAPFLLVHSNGKGGIQSNVLFLPDYNQKMSARPNAYFAKIATTMTFEDGTLVTAKDVADSTAYPLALAKAVEAAGTAFLKLANAVAEKNEYEVPPPHLYRILIEGNTISFLGGSADKAIKVTLLPQEKKGNS